MSFSENLKNALAQSNMTMTDLANSTGITYNMIKKYCAGNAEPTVSYALKMAKELNVSIDELMDHRAPERKNMFREVFERDFTYIEGFMRVVRRLPNKEALVDPHTDTSWTYSELNAAEEGRRPIPAAEPSGIRLPVSRASEDRCGNKPCKSGVCAGRVKGVPGIQ